MESTEKTDTPRRSTRLQRQRAVTPDLQILGPREFMKLNKSRQKIEFDQNSTSKSNVPDINIIPPTPVSATKKRRNTHTSVVSKKSRVDEIKETVKIVEVVASKEEKKVPKESKDIVPIVENKTDVNETKEQTVQSPTEEFHSAINEEVEEKSVEKTLEATNKDENVTNKQENDVKEQDVESDINNQKVEPEVKKLDQTPQLMDESIISVPESPSMISKSVIKDSTFSPEVDTSITITRPHIDDAVTPIAKRNIALRTSTPLSQRVLMRDTPKLSMPVLSALKKVLSPKVTENKKLNEESLNETLNGQFKMGNPLEKSILKSSRRKRSLSVADGESLMQKKVNFVSPQIMNIDTIDEKMLQSFKEERENSMIQQTLASGGGPMRRKRSMSESGTPAKLKIKVPNFKAIHEQQFKKMESIVDHAQRKAERAKRLATPSKISSLPKIKETTENNAVSKIPTRMPLKKVSSSENILHGIKNRTIKRSNSAETHIKPSKIPGLRDNENKFGSDKKVLPRILDTNARINTGIIGKVSSGVSKFTAIKKPSTVSTSVQKPTTSVQSMRDKVEERRERNMSLYKGNSSRAGLDQRKKNENILKGVRLNRRFDLQMQHRRMEGHED